MAKGKKPNPFAKGGGKAPPFPKKGEKKGKCPDCKKDMKDCKCK